MWKRDFILRGRFVFILFALFCTGYGTLSAQNAEVTNSVIVGIEGTVRVGRRGGPRLDEPSVNWPLLVGDRWWHVLRRYLPADAPPLWLWADPQLQAFQLDALHSTCPRWWASACESFARARNSRVLTVLLRACRAVAISSIENP